MLSIFANHMCMYTHSFLILAVLISLHLKNNSAMKYPVCIHIALLQIWVLVFCVWFVFFVTLAIFPAIQSDIVRLHFPIGGESNDSNRLVLYLIYR